MTTKKIWLLSFGIILFMSVYPIYMGAVMLLGYIQNGGIDVADYPSYIIPYTPICIALIGCTALLPLFFNQCKKFALPVLSVLGVGLFLGAEIGFEQIAVFTDISSKMKVETWQLLSCFMTPQIRASIWDSLSIRYNPLFKIHFYAISLLIVLAVTGIIYGFYKMAYTQNFTRKRPLITQLIFVIIFIGLCILACFTAFFRTGDINISPLSAVLMTIFFLIFGITAGVYTGTCFYEKQKLFSIIIPSVAAMAVTFIMYIGELVMINGTLFRLGEGFIFEAIGRIPFALIDIMTILTSGIITYFILVFVKKEKKI
jgi:hypothetical protein